MLERHFRFGPARAGCYRQRERKREGLGQVATERMRGWARTGGPKLQACSQNNV